MATLATLTIDLVGRSAQLTAELRRASGATKSWATTTKKMVSDTAKSFATTTKTISGSSAIIVASMTAIGYAVKSSLDNIDDLTLAAENLSVPVDNFNNLAYAAQLANTDIESVSDVIKDINVKVQDAAFANGGPLVDFFKQINQKASDWAQLRPDEQFKKFTEEINKMDANQARFWLDEINDSAASMFGTLYGSDAAFSKFVSEAENAGIAINAQIAGNARATRVEFDRLFALSSSTWTNIVGSASPAIEYVLKGINSWIIESAKAEGGFQSLGKNLTISMLRASQDITHSVVSMFDTLRSEAREIGAMLGKDWFSVPNADSLLLTLENTKTAMDNLQKNGEWVQPAGDVPGYWAMSAEQIEKYNDLQVRTAQLKNELNGNIDLTAFDAQIDKIIGKVNSVNSSQNSVTPQVNAPVIPSFSVPTPEQNTGASQLFSLDNTYADDAEKLALAHTQRLAQIKAMTLSEQEIQRKGFDSIETLRIDYKGREDAFYEQKQEEYKAAQETSLLSELGFEENALLSKQALAQADYDQRQLMIENAWSKRIITEEQKQALSIKSQEKYQKTISASSQAVTQNTVNFASQQMGVMTSMLSAAGEEQSTAYKVLFAAQKAAAIPSMMISTEKAATEALTIGPFAGPTMSTIIRGMGYASMGIVAGQALAGMAHDGIDEIPSEGTWLLDKGERVVDSSTNADLKNYLADDSGSSSGGVVVNLIEDASRAGTVEESSDGDTTTLDIRVAKLLQSSNTQTAAVMKSRYRSQQYGS